MNAAPGGGLRAAGGLWGPPARALCETLGRRFPQRHRPTWLSPGADQPTPVLIRLLVAGWLTFRVAAPRLSPATTWGPSPANLVVANRPRGLTRDRRPITSYVRAGDACASSPSPQTRANTRPSINTPTSAIAPLCSNSGADHPLGGCEPGSQFRLVIRSAWGCPDSVDRRQGSRFCSRAILRRGQRRCLSSMACCCSCCGSSVRRWPT